MANILTARGENFSDKSSFVIGDNDQLIGRWLYLAYSESMIFAEVEIKKPPTRPFRIHSLP